MSDRVPNTAVPVGGLIKILSYVIPRPAKGNGTPHQATLTELSYYKAFPMPPLDSSLLDWGKTYHSFLTYASALARKLLCVVATSVPNECLFSTTGEIVPQKKPLAYRHYKYAVILHGNLKVQHMPQYWCMWVVQVYWPSKNV